MTKKIILMGIQVLALVFTITVIGCGGGDSDDSNITNTTGGGGSGGIFTLTNIPSEYNGKYAGIEAGNGSTVNLAGCESINFSKQTITFPRISNGSVSIPMWLMKNNTSAERYSGNGTFEVGVIIFNSNNPNDDSKKGVYFPSVTFSNGSAARSWADGQGR